MSDTTAAPVTRVLGHKLTDDKAHILLRFEQPKGNEIALAIPQNRLFEMILSLARATALIPSPEGKTVEATAMQTNGFEFGQVKASGDFFVRFRLVAGGHLAFVMDKTMAQQLTKTMNATVSGGPRPAAMLNS